MTAPSLTEFLLARIAEDESVARYATVGPWRYDPMKMNSIDGEESVFAGPSGPDAICVASTGPENGQSMIDARHIATHDPSRVLAECEAKRRIVEEHPVSDVRSAYGNDTPLTCGTCQRVDSYGTDMIGDLGTWPCNTMQALALPYADHPDYQESWRP